MAYMKIENGKEILVLEKSDFDNAIDLDKIEFNSNAACLASRIAVIEVVKFALATEVCAKLFN